MRATQPVCTNARVLRYILPLLAAWSFALAVQAQTIDAPSVTFITIEGQKISLHEMRGKVVLVNFWATSCSICRAEMPELIQTYQQYRARGLELVAVAMSYDDPARIQPYIRKHGLPFPVVWDKSGEFGRRFYDVNATPTTFIVDKDGQIVSRTLGMIDFDKLHRFLNQALN